jgi:hypothetical protein
MSNGVMFITVRGTYDWSVMQTSTVTVTQLTLNCAVMDCCAKLTTR